MYRDVVQWNLYTSGTLRIVGERESAHAKLEARITLQYVQYRSYIYIYIYDII